MGEALISRGNSGGASGGGGTGASVRVTTDIGLTIECTNGTNTFTKMATDEVVEFNLGFGTWTFTAKDAGEAVNTKILEIDTIKIYELTIKGVNTFGIRIDMSETDPEAAVTYTDDAVGFTPLSVNKSSGACNYGSWADYMVDFFGCRPCIHKGTARTKYLNPNDYSKYEDGTAVGTMSSTLGNVMVEFKKLWYKYSVSGNILTFQVSSEDKSAEGYTQAAFKSMDGSGTVKDYMYYSAYEGYNESNVTYSWSGKTPTRNVTYTNFRNYCKANGSAYGMEDWCKRYYILGLLMLVTKTRGIQEAIGNGICDSNSAINTGTMDTKGLFYGGGSNVGVKCFGIENMWGNYWNWCDGIITLSSTTLGLKDCPPYNDTGSGYTSIADGYTRNSGLYPTKYTTALDGAVIVASVGQSDTSLGWQDLVDVSSVAGCVARVSGSYSNGLAYAGPFDASISGTPGRSSADYGARSVAA